MQQDIEKQKECYIEQSVRLAMGELNEPSEDDRSASIRFWQNLTDGERFNAGWEIAKRVHLAKGGSLNDLKMNKSVSRLIRRKS